MIASWPERFPARLGSAPPAARRGVRALYRILLEAEAASDAGESKRLEAWRAWAAAGAGEPPELDLMEAADSLREAGLEPSVLAPVFAAWRDEALRKGYASLAEFEGHARATAGAAGRLALAMAGHTKEADAKAAETLWAAYAMTASLQDAKAALARGRAVFPLAELEAAGYSEADLRMGVVNDRFRGVMKDVWKRIRTLYDDSRPLPRRLPFPQSVEVRYGWGKGAALLARISRGGFDVLHQRPALSRRERLPVALGALFPA